MDGICTRLRRHGKFMYGLVPIILLLALFVSSIFFLESVKPSSLSDLDWRDNYFSPYYAFVVATGTHTLLLLLIFIFIPFINPILIFIFVMVKQNNLRERIKLFFGNVLISFIFAIILFRAVDIPVGMYINNERSKENGKVIHLNEVIVQNVDEHNIAVKLSLTSSVSKEITVFGGIEYCFYDDEKYLFCINDYRQTQQLGLNDVIRPKENLYINNFTLDKTAFEQIMKSKKLNIMISFVGKETFIVRYLRTISINSPDSQALMCKFIWGNLLRDCSEVPEYYDLGHRVSYTDQSLSS